MLDRGPKHGPPPHRLVYRGGGNVHVHLPIVRSGRGVLARAVQVLELAALSGGWRQLAVARRPASEHVTSIRCGVSRKMISARKVWSSSQPPEAATGMVSPWSSAGADTAQSPVPTGSVPTGNVRELAASLRRICQPS